MTWDRRPNAWLRYGVAVSVVILALAVRAAFLGELGSVVPYVAFYPAVILAAFYGGLWAGLLATALSAFLSPFWIEPAAQSLGITHTGDRARLAIFIVSGVALSFLAESRRLAQARAGKAEAAAGVTVELEAATEALRQSEARYRSVVEDQTEVIIRFKPDGTILFVNEVYCRFFRKSREELLGTIWHPLVHPEDLPRLQEELGRLSPENTIVVTENRAFDGEGSVRWMQFVTRAFFDESGAFHELQAVGRDVTEWKEAEDALRQAREFLEKIMVSSPNAIYVLDLEGRFVMGNAASEHLSGYAESELLGQSFALAVPPEAQPEAEALFRQVAFQGQPFFDQERPILCKDGSVKIVLLSNAPLRENGKITSVVGIATDITERKLLENSLNQAKEAAEIANRAKSAFLANMSHELRTPMNGVLGMTELALMADIPQRAREYLQYVKQSGQALLEIINDILDLSKIELGKADLVYRPFRFREGLESALKPLSVSAASKGLGYEHGVDSAVPDHLVGDQGRLRQILTNLIGNAIKFTAKGTVRISVKVDGQAASPGAVRLLFTVQDDGVGISSDRLEEVFEAFSQVGLSSHVIYGGTGLGLSISKSLVEMMGGRIWAESEVGQGSTFYFTATFGLAEELPQLDVKTLPALPSPFRGLSILLGEDCKVNQILTVELLKLRGHQVEVAENGREVLEKLKAEDFDVVFMDVRMPVMDGLTALQAIRSGEAGQDKAGVTMVALTAHALQDDRERFLTQGMDDYLSKPIDLDELDHVLARIRPARSAVACPEALEGDAPARTITDLPPA